MRGANATKEAEGELELFSLGGSLKPDGQKPALVLLFRDFWLCYPSFHFHLHFPSRSSRPDTVLLMPPLSLPPSSGTQAHPRAHARLLEVCRAGSRSLGRGAATRPCLSCAGSSMSDARSDQGPKDHLRWHRKEGYNYKPWREKGRGRRRRKIPNSTRKMDKPTL